MVSALFLLVGRNSRAAECAPQRHAPAFARRFLLPDGALAHHRRRSRVRARMGNGYRRAIDGVAECAGVLASALDHPGTPAAFAPASWVDCVYSRRRTGVGGMVRIDSAA